jgi:hypothetical protein
MFGNGNKSVLTFQVEGRLSSYLSDIDNCDSFSADSLTKMTKTMKMTECFHSLLNHIKINCINENAEFIYRNQLNIDSSLENISQYIFNWTPFENKKIVSGIVEIDFIIPEHNLLEISNFKSDSIENLTNLIIHYMTLSFSKADNKLLKKLIIVKTKNFDRNEEDFISLLKTELEYNCKSYKTTPTFLYLIHKDNLGHYHKHYSNYADN